MWICFTIMKQNHTTRVNRRAVKEYFDCQQLQIVHVSINLMTTVWWNDGVGPFVHHHNPVTTNHEQLFRTIAIWEKNFFRIIHEGEKKNLKITRSGAVFPSLSTFRDSAQFSCFNKRFSSTLTNRWVLKKKRNSLKTPKNLKKNLKNFKTRDR